MNILFTHSYFLRFDPKQWKQGKPYAPLATIQAAALLREHGYQVSLEDIQLSAGPEALIESLSVSKPDVLVIYDDGFNYLTKMCLTNMREAAFSMAKAARDLGITTIISSSDSTDHYEQYLTQGCNIVLLGEAEYSLLDTVNALKNAEDTSVISGTASVKNGKTVYNPRREVIRELDALPLPAWDLVDLKKYRDVWMKHNGYFSINLGTTRGCPYKCNWCAKPIYGNRYNSRSVEHVIREIELLKSMISFDHIWFCDDIFGLKPDWVKNFAKRLREKNISIKYMIQSRADLLVQENYIADLARSGCETVWMGAESGSQSVLDAMDKGTTISQIYAATRLLKQYGIRVAYFLQFGYLGESKSDIDLTMQMLKENMPDDIGISVSYPLPGTPFYEKVKNQLKEKSNWTDSDDLALMFRSTFSPEYYKQLHRYVHKTYRMWQSVESIKKPFPLSLQKIRKIASFGYFLPMSWYEKQKLKAEVHD